MSARVFSHMSMSEFRRLVRSNDTQGPVAEGTAAVARVRKNLFGPVDHEESLLFVDTELATLSKSKVDKWNFDFVTEQPFHGPSSRYLWERVAPLETIPEPYALKRLSYLYMATDNTNTTDVKTTKTATTGVNSTSSGRTTKKSTQSAITDFLKIRKRPSSAAMAAGEKKILRSSSSSESTSSRRQEARKV